MIKGFLLIFSSLMCIIMQSQEHAQITHYSLDDGLYENHVLCTLQDKKGNMWFGTFSGLDKFDGYTFKNFKGNTAQKYQLHNFRIDRLKEDQHGYLWIRTNDFKFYRFDPSTENFLPVPAFDPKFKNTTARPNRTQILPNGDLWLYSTNTIHGGCFLVQNSESSENPSLRYFDKKDGTLASNRIFKIFQDQEKNTWILSAEGLSLLKYGSEKPELLYTDSAAVELYAITDNQQQLFVGGNSGTFFIVNKTNLKAEFIQTPSNNHIIELYLVNTSELLLVTSTNQFYVFNLKSKIFKEFSIKSSHKKVFGSYLDKKKRVWFDTEYSGAMYFDTQTKQMHTLPVKQEPLTNVVTQKFHLIEDSSSNTWIQIRQGGFYKFNEKLKTLETLLPNKDTEADPSYRVHSAIADNQGNLWLSTYLQGIDKVVFHHPMFSFTRPLPGSSYSLNNEVRALFTDSKNRLWVATKRGRLFIYTSNKSLIGEVNSDGKIKGSGTFGAPVYSILEDYNGIFWLATKGAGLIRAQEHLDGNFTLQSFQYKKDDPYSISSNLVYSVFEDRKHNIWVGTFGGGVNKIEQHSGDTKFINHRNRLTNYPMQTCARIRHVSEDNAGNILLGTTQGLVVSNSAALQSDKITFDRYFHSPNDTSSIPGNDITYILPSSTGEIFLAMIDGGVIQVKNNSDSTFQFSKLTDTNGNTTKITNAMVEDKNGNIWMSFQTQIVKFKPKTKEFEFYKPFSKAPYFFSEAAVSSHLDGEIVFGTSDGCISFIPEKIQKSNYVPPLILTDLHIFNKPITVGTEGSPLKKSIDDTTEITLTHHQNIFSIKYAAIDHTAPESIQYAYMLEGLETEWNYVNNIRTANYINLPKGQFTFRVKSTNADGKWVNNERSIKIVKRPSFSESVWGRVFYVILFVLLSFIVAYILFVIFRLRNEIGLEKHLANMKLKFFTNISHELRTPLTLIVSPIDNLLKTEILSKKAKEQLLMVQNNTNRLLKLINQILDFRKIQSNKMKLFIEKTHIGSFMQEISDNFQKLAEEHHIHFSIKDQTNNTTIWVDKDKVEKVMYNLLSNAFKFTSQNNDIQILITEDNTHTHITIKDQGEGISNDSLKLLFKRFESFSSTNTMFQAGTGIGLSLVKELMELHHGSISVHSEKGKGSAFKVSFRKGVEHYGKKEEIILHNVQKSDVGNARPIETSTQTIALENEEIEEKKALPKDLNPVKIMIVEDNLELLNFLATSLQNNYEVITAVNGKLALELAADENPNIIISDIMMPDMDGLELAKTLKMSINTSHIPLILLTAKSDISSKLLAMDMGVDDYITKPFNLSFLQARIDNLLKSRLLLQTYFTSTLTSGIITLPKPNVTNIDELFLTNIIKYLEENYENSGVSVDGLANNIGVSRSSFFQKLKSLTGLAPVEFIREFRMQKATQLIELGEKNVSQLAYKVGINDARYFSKCFKLKFGITPSKYILKKSQTK